MRNLARYVSESNGRPPEEFDTGEKGRISTKKRDPQAKGEFVWLRRPEI
jgi:hypothetical protein